jgi:hypothetical protein
MRVDADRESDDDSVNFEAFVGVAPGRFFDLFRFVERKDAQGYAKGEIAPKSGPKSVALSSYVSDLESEYLKPMTRDSWADGEQGTPS